MVSQLIEILANFVVNAIGLLGYVGVFLLMLFESCGIPFPSEIIMPFSGFLVAQGKMTLLLIVLAGTLGNLAGSLLAYYIGLKGGRPLIEKYGKYILISRHDLDSADRFFTRYGQWAVFFGRLLPVVRTYISFPAGIAKMDIKKFSLFTFLGALPWCFLFGYLGVRLGAHWEFIRLKLHQFDLLMAFLVIAAVVWYVYRHLKNRQQTEKVF